jgi:spermidine/putrescine transport system permease protein
MGTAKDIIEQVKRRDIRSRWLLSAPALLIILFAAAGPLLIVVVYSFLAPGSYGDVKWQFSTDAWVSVLLERDMFDDTLSFASAHLTIFWRSIKLSVATTFLTLLLGFPTAYFITTRSERSRDFWLFLITIPFWTNVLIRTFAIQEVIRNGGVVNSLLEWSGITNQPLQLMYTDFAVLLGMIYVFLPLMVLPLYASMEKIDFRLVEAAYDLYATRFRCCGG